MRADLLVASLSLPVVLVASFLLAKAGEPQAQWFWCSIVGWC